MRLGLERYLPRLRAVAAVLAAAAAAAALLPIQAVLRAHATSKSAPFTRILACTYHALIIRAASVARDVRENIQAVLSGRQNNDTAC